MAGIYQQIWTADQQENGVEAILDTQRGDKNQGWVKVNSKTDDSRCPDFKVLPEVYIPAHKRKTYELASKLFNNYVLHEDDHDSANESPEEQKELAKFIDAIVDTKPMRVARQYIERQTNTDLTDHQWYALIVEHWFTRYTEGGDPHLTGFEHVIVGEMDDNEVNGYHCWYKYYLDDGFAHKVDDGIGAFNGLKNDRIIFQSDKLKNGQEHYPESITISFRWLAPDYESETVHDIEKPVGGFFVGCSIEGLMAMGTVRAHKYADAPRIAVIEGAKYSLVMHHSPSENHIRSFYPKFLGPVDINDAGGRTESGSDTWLKEILDSKVRISAAMVNPVGEDIGSESVTIVNVGNKSLKLKGWTIEDKNNRSQRIKSQFLNAGRFLQVELEGDDLKLSNQGGEITLLDGQGRIVHKVTYSKTQAKAQGQTILF